MHMEAGLIQWKGGHAKRKEHKKILTAGTDLQGYNGVGVGEGEWQKRNGTGKKKKMGRRATFLEA